MEVKTPASVNNLFPVFLKLEQLNLLVVGGGNVALEKLNALFNNAPEAQVTAVALDFLPAVQALTLQHSGLVLVEKAFEPEDLEGKDLVIAATNNRVINEVIREEAGRRRILANVADTPDLCDFYLGSIVQKGDLKIAISTNGRSPTIAKRIREVLNEAIPPEIDDTLKNMNLIRNRLNGSFSDKVRKLNEITGVLVEAGQDHKSKSEKRWRRIAARLVLAFTLMVLGHLIISSLPAAGIAAVWEFVRPTFNQQFLFFCLAGFFAQMVDGVLGMGYGVTSSIGLMSAGVNPVAISAAIHTSEVFTTGVSGYSHYRFGNVNKKLFRHLVIPGVVGAVMGVILLVFLGENSGEWLRPLIAFYAMFLGFRILMKAFQKKVRTKKIQRIGWLAWTGGLLDSFGGGGWGPIVNSTLIAKGRSPKYTIGSASLAEFFVTVASAVTFLIATGITHIGVVLGLMIGGMIAAPFAAKLTGKLPAKTMMIGVGIMVILWSVRLIVKSVWG